jgi:2-iminobutanoate/2-iminopropanoate deaminase
MSHHLDIIATGNAPAAIGPYSQAIRYNNVIYTAGQIGLEPQSGQMVNGDVAAQTRQVIQNLNAVLLAANSGLDHVIKTTVFLTDMGNFQTMNQVYEEYFGVTRPARSTVAVAALPRGALVEIECIAVVKE